MNSPQSYWMQIKCSGKVELYRKFIKREQMFKRVEFQKKQWCCFKRGSETRRLRGPVWLSTIMEIRPKWQFYINQKLGIRVQFAWYKLFNWSIERKRSPCRSEIRNSYFANSTVSSFVYWKLFLLNLKLKFVLGSFKNEWNNMQIESGKEEY